MALGNNGTVVSGDKAGSEELTSSIPNTGTDVGRSEENAWMAAPPITVAGQLAIIIPAYNEASNIRQAVEDVSAAIPGVEVIVVSDGSIDATVRVASDAGATVIDLPYNLGIGGAVQTGYKFAMMRGYRLVARLDADGQHDPNQLSRLLEPVLNGETDIAIGSRFIGDRSVVGHDAYRATRLRAMGIQFFAHLVSAIVGQRITDTTSGFQACNADAAAYFARRLPCDYPEIEMIVAASKAGYKIREVPVRMRNRAAGRSSITSARSVYYVIKMLLVLLVSVMRRPDERVQAFGDACDRPSSNPRTDRGVA